MDIKNKDKLGTEYHKKARKNMGQPEPKETILSEDWENVATLIAELIFTAFGARVVIRIFLSE